MGIKDAIAMGRKILVIKLVLITIPAIQPTIASSRTVEEPSHEWALVMAVKPGENCMSI